MIILIFFFFKLIFEKEGVYLHTNAKRTNQDTSIPGFIRIVERVTNCNSGLQRWKNFVFFVYLWE